MTKQSYVANASIGCARAVSYSDRTFHATLDYTFSYVNLSAFDDETAALLDVLGVNFNPAIIWNALPWSFVVDWLIGVSQWVDQFKVRLLEPVTYVHQYCWSTRIARQIRLDYGWDAVQPVARISELAYKRQVHQPDYVREIQLSGLSLKEFSLAAALGLSRR
jgi:hypothetical protein